MKAVFLVSICLLVFAGACSDSRSKDPSSDQRDIPGIIFDTDMGPDYDDAGALTVLHALAANGECEILATLACNSAPLTAPAIEVFNRYFGKADIPVGVPAKAPDITPGNHWTDSLVQTYLSAPGTNSDYPSALSIYRKVLASQPDNSVTIVTVGFLSNLVELLRSGADSLSPLAGIDLVRKKVRNYVAMAGKFPDGREFNIYTDSTASAYVIKNWPSPILFSGFEIGADILTGERLAASGLQTPAQMAYRICLQTFGKNPAKNRMSWDQTAVLCAVRDPENYFYLSGQGTFICNSDGSNSWDPDRNSGHRFLVHKYPYSVIVRQLEDLMMFDKRGK